MTEKKLIHFELKYPHQKTLFKKALAELIRELPKCDLPAHDKHAAVETSNYRITLWSNEIE